MKNWMQCLDAITCYVKLDLLDGLNRIKRVKSLIFLYYIINFYMTIFAFTDDSVNSIVLSKPTILKIDFIYP